MPFTIQEKSDGLIFKIRVQPRSSRNHVVGLYGDALKINLTAPPVDNAANKACGLFLAVVSGHTGRNKQVMVYCQKDDNQRESIKKMILSWAKN